MKTLTALIVLILAVPAIPCCVIPGDTDLSGEPPNVADIMHMADVLFKGADPICPESLDVNNDGKFLIDDCNLMVDYLFRGGDAPVCGSYEGK